MYKIGDKFKPKGWIFNTVIYEITKVEYNDFKNETLYCLELIVPQTKFDFNEKEVLIMKITDIKVRKLFDDDSTMKAVVSVTFDGQLALHDIKVIYAKERYFIVMPSKKNADGTFRDVVHPINAEFRGLLESAVIDAYDQAVEEAAREAALVDV